jgi:hypothetical protein
VKRRDYNIIYRECFMRSKGIKDIVEQLQRLQLQQDDLLARLHRASSSPNSGQATTRATRVPPDAAKALVIGDNVKVRNPRASQANRGQTGSIGRSRIIIKTSNGSRIIWAPHNLYLDDE